MANKTPSQLLRSNSTSYYGMLRPYVSDYSTLPLQPKNRHQLPPWPRRSTASGCISSSSPKTLSHSNSLRAFNFNVNPLWRHTSPAHHHHHHHHHHNQHNQAQRGSAEIGGSRGKFTPSPLDKDHRPRATYANALIMQRSLPLFEVLPPLTGDGDADACSTAAEHELLYQNEYVLDGVRYDWNSAASPQGKLKLDYFKFLKSITTKSKPSDRDVIFGNAKVLFKRPTGWERSRIEWLVELERRQEWRSMMRRSRRRQQREKTNKNNNNNSNNNNNNDNSCIKQKTTTTRTTTKGDACAMQNVKLRHELQAGQTREEDEDSLLDDWCFPWGKNTLNTLMGRHAD